MSNKHQMLRKSHVHRPTSSQEDLFILLNGPNHFFRIKLYITGWAKNCQWKKANNEFLLISKSKIIVHRWNFDNKVLHHNIVSLHHINLSSGSTVSILQSMTLNHLVYFWIQKFNYALSFAPIQCQHLRGNPKSSQRHADPPCWISKGQVNNLWTRPPNSPI